MGHWANVYLRWVQTDMGTMGAKSAGMKKAPTTVEESITGMLNKVRLERST